MRELHRLYYLAVELKPKLPDKRLLDLLPKTWGKLIESGVKEGLGSGQANYSQLEELYKRGCENGIPASLEEFKALLITQLRHILDEKGKELSHADYARYQKSLSNYYESNNNQSLEWYSFNTPAPPLVTFSSCFPPIDEIIKAGIERKPGVFTEIITMLGFTGTGKSTLGLSLTARWNYGSAWFFDPEVGSGLMLYKINSMEMDFDESKQYVYGHYDPHEILQKCIDDPDPNRLIVFDSLHAVCGDGDTSDSRKMYGDYYRCFVEIKKHVKLILVTTQIKRGDDGHSLDSAAGSRNIEFYSGALISAKKGGVIAGPNNEPYNQVTLYAIKNRMGQDKGEVDFVFDYTHNRYVGMLNDFLEDTPI